jgi:hypothetical protein
MPVPLAALPAHSHISVFLAALRASGAADQPELMPPLYRSVNFMQACLQFRLLIHSVAEGSGALSVPACGLFHPQLAPMCFAVLAHMELH